MVLRKPTQEQMVKMLQALGFEASGYSTGVLVKLQGRRISCMEVAAAFDLDRVQLKSTSDGVYVLRIAHGSPDIEL